jgi:hypothetical protein
MEKISADAFLHSRGYEQYDSAFDHKRIAHLHKQIAMASIAALGLITYTIPLYGLSEVFAAIGGRQYICCTEDRAGIHCKGNCEYVDGCNTNLVQT